MRSTILSAIAIIIAIMVFYSWRSAPGQAADNSGLDELKQLRAEVSALKRGQNRGQLLANERAKSPEPAEEESEPGAPDPADPPAERRANNQTGTSQEIAKTLSGRFGAEAMDQAWRSNATALAEHDVRMNMPEGSRIMSLECRSTMCKAELMHSDEAHFMAYSQGLMRGDRKWLGEAMSARPELDTVRGPIQSVVYLMREGHTILPPVGPESE